MTITEILKAKKRSIIPVAEVTAEILKLRKDVKNHPALAHWEVEKVCKYCHKNYTYNLLVGDCNLGACSKSRCVLTSMRDNL